MTRTLVLMSEQPFFDTLTLEVSQGAHGNKGLTAEGYASTWAMGLTRMGPEYPSPEIMEILEETYGQRLDDDLVSDAARLVSALPPTSSIPIIEPTAMQTADETSMIPVVAEGPKKKRTPRKSVPPVEKSRPSLAHILIPTEENF